MARRKRTGNRTFPRRSRFFLPFDVSNDMTDAGSVVASGDLLGNYFSQTGEEIPIGTTIGPVRWTSRLIPNVLTSISTVQLEAVMQLEREGGRATLPVPGVDIMDAMWYGQMFYEGQLLESAASVFSARAQSKDFETKSMRKITGNGQILRIFTVLDSNTDFNFDSIGTVMIMLP